MKSSRAAGAPCNGAADSMPAASSTSKVDVEPGADDSGPSMPDSNDSGATGLGAASPTQATLTQPPPGTSTPEATDPGASVSAARPPESAPAVSPTSAASNSCTACGNNSGGASQRLPTQPRINLSNIRPIQRIPLQAPRDDLAKGRR